MNKYSQIRALFRLIIKEIPEARISSTMLYLLRYNLKNSQKDSLFLKDNSFLKNFASNLELFYIKKYNLPRKELMKKISRVFISKNIILKIPIINDDLIFEEEYWKFYKFLRNFYLVNLASNEEFIIVNSKKNRTKVNKMINEKRLFEKEKVEYELYFDIPTEKVSKTELLFDKNFYFNLKFNIDN